VPPGSCSSRRSSGGGSVRRKHKSSRRLVAFVWSPLNRAEQADHFSSLASASLASSFGAESFAPTDFFSLSAPWLPLCPTLTAPSSQPIRTCGLRERARSNSGGSRHARHLFPLLLTTAHILASSSLHAPRSDTEAGGVRLAVPATANRRCHPARAPAAHQTVSITRLRNEPSCILLGHGKRARVEAVRPSSTGPLYLAARPGQPGVHRSSESTLVVAPGLLLLSPPSGRPRPRPVLAWAVGGADLSTDY